MTRCLSCQCQLIICIHIDGRAILCASVIALPIALCGVMRLPENRQQGFKAAFFRIIDNPHNLCMASASAAYLFIGWVRGQATCITNRCAIDAVQLPEQPFRAPKTTKPQLNISQPFWKRRHNRRAQNGVIQRAYNRHIPPRQCLCGGRQSVFEWIRKKHAQSASKK